MVYFINYIRSLKAPTSGAKPVEITGNNASYPFKLMIKIDNKEIRTTISAIVNRLVSSFDVEKIVLFGSYVTGKQTSDSDIDLFVLLNTRKKGIERYAMVSEALEPRRIPMDIIVKTPAEIRKRKNYFDPFIRNIEINGKVLYEKKA